MVHEKLIMSSEGMEGWKKRLYIGSINGISLKRVVPEHDH